ncbi:MAG: hypothetical protein A3E84_00370 [Gammaproteobacteria bacterium RIFCSPHIGHO2_12_FULL_42_13]|nr:MAG: hypothetical protein A3E84_00370 [Gammaproteobacteria bacterium RIFCSPHIGHO2_12_FULL_42_13]
MSAFQSIGLICRAKNDAVEALTAVKNYLLKKKIAVFLEKDTAFAASDNITPIFTEDKIPTEINLIITIGGDGSLLHAARCAHQANIPVLGINRGRLGFLTDIHPTELEKIDEVLKGNYAIEERFLLDTIFGCALNDVVLLPGSPRLIEFDIFINKKFMCAQRADGLIIATPTGSTAYALSGGGPILHPSLNAVVLVPMFPHTLSNRPIVVDGSSTIELVISKNNSVKPMISCDSNEHVFIEIGDRFCITQHTRKLKLIHPSSYDYFGTLREKLGWNR